MDIYERRGTNFEVSVSLCMEQIANSVVITHFDVFSFSLNKVTPIDTLILLGKHVFVLELKRFSEKISGNYSERRWFGYSNQNRYSIFNPIVQVKEKMRCLQRKLNEYGFEYWDLDWNYFVVVPDSCCIHADKTVVITQQELFQKIFKIKDIKEQNSDLLKFLVGGG
jgi:hypothetical protein